QGSRGVQSTESPTYNHNPRTVSRIHEQSQKSQQVHSYQMSTATHPSSNHQSRVVSDFKLWTKGACATPRSVMIAVTYRLGVTSKAGLATCTPSGAIAECWMCVTSRLGRCSIGMCAPEGKLRSSVEIGAAT